jgi:hypothetical protein
MPKPLTFDQFVATGRTVDDLRTVIADHSYDVKTPGRVYAGDLVIEDSLGAAEGVWMLTISNYSQCSNDLRALERDLYEFGCSEKAI